MKDVTAMLIPILTTTVLLLVVVVFPIRAIWKAIKRGQDRKQYEAETERMRVEGQEPQQALPIEGAYQKRWLFSYNEKDAYNKLKPIAEELGLTIFAKVRLLDLLEPVKRNPKYKTYFYKIQAKHVDFVLCDEKLVARYVIELDDSSHDAADRKQRDSFVDQVLTSVGYKIIHLRAITEDIREQLK